MKIQLKRNQSASTAQLPTLSAGEPLWFKDQLYIGSVGTGASGDGTEGELMQIANAKYLYDGFLFPNALTDNDGNRYGAVIIGNQVWLASNYRCKTFSDGTPIAYGGGDPTEFSDTTPYWSYPGNNSANFDSRGLLYNNAAVLNGANASSANPSGVQGIAPNNWHVPSLAEWQQLNDYVKKNKRYLADPSAANSTAKALCSRWYWTETTSASNSKTPGYDRKSNNATGLSLRGTGRQTEDTFTSVGAFGSYATCTEYNETNMHSMYLRYNFSYPFIGDSNYIYPKGCSNALRLVSDLTPQEFLTWYRENFNTIQYHTRQKITANSEAFDYNATIDIQDGRYISVEPDSTANTITVNTNVSDGYVFPNAVQDGDGNWYDAVTIGDQVWLTENLRAIHYSDGTTEVARGAVGTYSSDSALWCIYNTTNYHQKYGKLYNWKAAMGSDSASSANPSGVQGLAPTGWHIPSQAEFQQLIDYVKSQSRYPSRRSLATSLSGIWTTASSNVVGTNLTLNNGTGFNAKANGCAYSGYETVDTPSFSTTFITSTEADGDSSKYYMYSFTYASGSAASAWGTFSSRDKSVYSGIRCVCDLDPTQFRSWYVNQYGGMQHIVKTNTDIVLANDVSSSTASPSLIFSRGSINPPDGNDYIDWWMKVTGSGAFQLTRGLLPYAADTENASSVVNVITATSSSITTPCTVESTGFKVTDHIDNNTGLLKSDGTVDTSNYITGPQSSTTENIPVFANATGNIESDSGITIRRLWEDKEIANLFGDSNAKYSIQNYYISSDTNLWKSDSTYRSWIMPLESVRKITVTSNGNNPARIAFLRSYTVPADGDTPDFSQDPKYNTLVLESGGTSSVTSTYIVPSDAEYLYVYAGSTDSFTHKPSSIKVTGIGITEHSGGGTKFVKDDGDTEHIAFQRLWEDFDIRPNYTRYSTIYSGQINSSNAWADLTTHTHFIVPLDGIRKIGITRYHSSSGTTRNAYFAFLKSYIPAQDSSSFPTSEFSDEYTGRLISNSDDVKEYIVPKDAKYLYVFRRNTSVGSYLPNNLYLTGIGITEHTGDGTGFIKDDGSIDNNSYIPVATAALGSATKPIYLSSNSVFSECSMYAGGTAVTLNGENKAALTASFYAPISAGTNGQYLKSNGSGAPTWVDLPADSDTKVTQTKTASTYTFWRPLIIGKQYASSAPTASTALNFNTPSSDPTDIVYSTHLGGFQPSTGTLAVVGIKKLTDDGKLDGSDTKLWNTNGGIVTIGASGGPAAFSHTHGNITNDGKVGTVANLPLITGQNGVVITGSFGTASGTFCEGNDSRLSDARTPSNNSDLVHITGDETITGIKTFSNGLILNDGTSWTSTDRAIPFSKSGEPKTIQYVYNDANKGLTFNPATGELKAAKFTKRNGTKAQILLANGDNIDAGTSGYYLKANGTTDAPTWTQFPTIPTVPTNVSAFNNDAGYLTSFTETDPTVPDWAKAANKPSYSYTEITGTPTNVSAFTNDAAYITLRDLPTDKFGTVFVDTSAATKAKTATVPYTYTLRTGNTFILHLNVANTNTAATLNINSTGAKSVRINGAAPTSSNWTAGTYLCYYDGTYYQMYTAKNPYNYEDLINQPTIPTVPTNVSAFTNDANYITGSISGQVVTIGSNSITIPIVPTNVSAFTNDAGYLTSHQSIDKIISSSTAQTAPTSAVSLAGGDTLTLHKVSWTGTYSDLIGTPSVPDPANDADINVSNGTASAKLTSTNSSTGKTLKITGSKGITISAPTVSGNILTVDISHTHTDIAAGTNIGGNTNETPGYGDTFNVPYFSYDAQGHITGSGTKTVKIPASDNTDDKVKQQYYASSSYTNWRPIPLGYSSGSSSFTPSTETQSLYTFKTILAQPSTGSIRAGRFIKTDPTSATGILLADGSDIPQSTFLTSFTEIDPTVPDWAKASTKPAYNLDEVSDGDTRKLLVLGNTGTTAAAGNHTHDGVYQPVGNYLTAESNGFGKVSVAAQSTGTSNLSGTTSSKTLNSDSAADTLNIATGNKWIQIKAEGTAAASTADTDKLTFGHIVPGVATTGGSLQKFNYDEAGHITAASTPTASDLTAIIGNAYSTTDEKVTPEAAAASTAYPMLLASSDSTPTANGKPKYSSNLSATGTGDIVFTKSSTTGTIQYDGTDKCFKFIFS